MHKTIVLAGGSGLIGKRLQQMLHERGYTVRVLTRTPTVEGEFGWDPAAGRIDEAALKDAEAIINLAGAGIADARWTPRRKQLLIDSRVQSARVLCETIRKSGQFPECYISASAIGWYGDTGEELLFEEHLPGSAGFMPQCCVAWEQAAEKVGALGVRTVMLRIGVVLAREGGALAEMIKPMRFGLGAYFGNGKAWWSWIHRDDLCRMFIWALEHQQIDGIFNAVAPHPVRNLPMVKACADAMHRRVLLAPAPELALQLALGEMSAVVLNSNKVSCDKALAAGFTFKYPEIDGALEAIFTEYV
jgi:uncharacterized protein